VVVSRKFMGACNKLESVGFFFIVLQLIGNIHYTGNIIYNLHLVLIFYYLHQVHGPGHHNKPLRVVVDHEINHVFEPCVYVYTDVCVCVCVCVCLWVCMHTHVHTYAFESQMCVCACIYMYTHTLTHTHSHTHTPTHTLSLSPSLSLCLSLSLSLSHRTPRQRGRRGSGWQ
jgi:hypothetical protein